MLKKNPDKILENYHFEEGTLIFSSQLTLNEVNRISAKLIKKIRNYSENELRIDLSEVTKMDSAGAVFLGHIPKQLPKKNINIIVSGASEKIQNIIDTFSVPKELTREEIERTGLFERIGRKTYDFRSNVVGDYIYLMADLAYWTVLGFFNRREQRKGEVVNQALNIGVNALPLIALMAFLIGLVLALQSAAQLRQFGANIFLVDLVVIFMTAEMGPLLTAVMIAGRSGSAIASELASMKVAEEIDALNTLGLNPVRYLVVPKMQASILTLPFLTLLADIFGIFGGMIVAFLYLDISFFSFFHRMADSLLLRDIITGIIKSLVFAGIIVQTGTFFGLHVEGGAVGVGKFTTKAVVTSIFLVILADAIMGLLFY
ncbi:MAG: MlaE family lipid ABC transporter permease subunit [Calditrichaeota bacterium]|nr:MAG: MlaE family lipid ABC transporter permease subunit [Calditrichota bacterium]MBL1204653.1 MlaE family lipid ABC transporter permease subunit [Calditrichota bacterium]NOG44481.1 MlaE family lipid ABC transporter permease subunit [Calditrichota bacterium]